VLQYSKGTENKIGTDGGEMMLKLVDDLVDKVAKVIQDRDNDIGECADCWDEAEEVTRNSYRDTARLVLSIPAIKKALKEE